MIKARLIWPPYPYQAGFCITDDTDAATLETVRLVYDFLLSVNLPTTKTVWAFEPKHPCGIPATPASTLRGVTLQDRDYLNYCRSLRAQGFEIALHGASAGNNTRDMIIAAFNLLESEFGNDGTYICHAKNADNIYWEHKTAPGYLSHLLVKRFSRYQCFGEQKNSPYFWGDVCADKVKQIRLFRTRNTNTLAFNPSMPYFDERKPYVRSWFSATKRSFHDCTSEDALDKLCRENGLTVLYQYLHRYADGSRAGVSSQFEVDALRLVNHPDIWTATTAQAMDRLRAMRRVFIGFHKNTLYLVNTGETPIEKIQLILSDKVFHPADEVIEQNGNRLCVKRIDPQEIKVITFRGPVRALGKRCIPLNQHGHGRARFGFGECIINVGDQHWQVDDRLVLPPQRFSFRFNKDGEPTQAVSRASTWEQHLLFAGQAMIIVRELALRRRSVDYQKFLDAEEIALENHDNW